MKLFSDYREGEESYSDLMEYVSIPESETDATKGTQSSTEVTTVPIEIIDKDESPSISEKYDIVWPTVDFEALSEINTDIVGWIYVEGTNINYPIVQGTDNSYYLKRLFDGTYNGAGCIFLDADCNADFTSSHSIIYGHHLRNKTMFSELMGYKEQEFYEEHPIGLLLTPEGRYVIEFFSGYITKDTSNAWQLFFQDGEYRTWLNTLINESSFTSSVCPDLTDKVLTLSTCTYEYDNARFVLHGILRAQE